jgi:hypothetical protein
VQRSDQAVRGVLAERQFVELVTFDRCFAVQDQRQTRLLRSSPWLAEHGQAGRSTTVRVRSLKGRAFLG